ncbi:glutathione S-transferase family protein [Sinimarinibacterium thermocellulolyticum]|uniref:Glutathione S-transferase family protein n=1 Tax=Sinimarinibacterium thermocellulolyticum TaxID=3170016 RepID=A0ABV2AD31_9GAMM
MNTAGMTPSATTPKSTPGMTPVMTLYTVAASPSSEKVRWALDAAHLRYCEHRLTPFLHHASNLRIGGSLGVSLPTLQADGELIQDSTQILEWLERHRAPFALIPQDAETRAEVMRYEARFDHIGMHVVRLMYATLLKDPDLVRRLWSLDAGLVQARVLRLAFPLILGVFRRGLGMEPALIAHSRKVVERALDELARLADGGRVHLAGGALSVADITAASRLAPLVCPDEHLVFSDPEYRDAMQPLLEAWHGHPGADWVRTIYRLHRRPESRCRGGAAPPALAAHRRRHQQGAQRKMAETV